MDELNGHRLGTRADSYPDGALVEFGGTDHYVAARRGVRRANGSALAVPQ